MNIGASLLYGLFQGKDLVETAFEVKEAGFEWAELHLEENPHPQSLFNGSRNFSKRELKELPSVGLKYSFHIPYAGISFVSRGNKELESVNYAKRTIDEAFGLGAKAFVFHLTGDFNEKKRKEHLNIFIENFQEVVNNYTQKGAVFSVENLTFSLGTKPEDIKYVLNNMQNINFCLDTGHANIAGTLEDLLKLPIHHVHMHDNNRIKDQHSAIGEGSINFDPIFNKLEQENFNGVITIENCSLADCIKSKKVIESLKEAKSSF